MPGARKPLDEGRDDSPPLDRGRHRARHVEQSVQVRVGEKLAEDLEAALATSHAREPVVNQGGGHSASRGGPQRDGARVRCRQ